MLFSVHDEIDGFWGIERGIRGVGSSQKCLEAPLSLARRHNRNRYLMVSFRDFVVDGVTLTSDL